MIDDVYNAKILGFAGNIARIGRLEQPDATATAHSKLCGSTVTIDLKLQDQGAPDNTQPFWQFLNPAYPMAAHPDQVWIDGVEQQQVASRAQVTAGTFYLDEATSQLYLGTNPTGKTVEASTIAKALSVRAPGVVIRGIGVRRYAPSVYMVAGITLEQPSARIENVIVEDIATNGLSVLGTDTTIDRVTVRGAGMLGLHARFADRLVLTSVLATGSNAERFNITPNAGGMKIGQTRGVTLRNSDFSGNLAHGFWIDMSVYDTKFVNNRFADNTGDGLFLEISAKAVVADNLFSNNGGFGIKVNNTSDVKIWNNTFVGNSRPLNIVQDPRRNTNRSDSAVDPRQPWPDPTMPWTLGPVTIANNVVGQVRSSANCMLCVEDYSRMETAEQMGVVANGNVYNRASSVQPTWLVVWSRGTIVNPYTFTTLAAFTAQTGQEASGLELTGASIVDANGVLRRIRVVAGAGESAAPARRRRRPRRQAGRHPRLRHLALMWSTGRSVRRDRNELWRSRWRRSGWRRASASLR